MRFLSSKRGPQSAEDSAFAERLSAIASRSRAGIEPDSTPQPLTRIASVERRFWAPSELPDGASEAEAA